MSATNRKQAAKAHDKYPTDIRLVHAAFDMMVEHHPHFMGGVKHFVEPGAGRGPFCQAATLYCRNLTSKPVGVELFVDKHRFDYQLIQKDFLRWQWARGNYGYGFIATNPPFTLAENFIRKSLTMLVPTGMMLFLMRIGVAAGVCRTELWQEVVKLKELWMVRRRPNFNVRSEKVEINPKTGKKKVQGSDATEYAFFLMEHRTPANAAVPTLFRWLEW